MIADAESDKISNEKKLESAKKDLQDNEDFKSLKENALK